MKKLSIILSLIMLIALFPSCGVDDSKPDFEFSYEIEKTEYLRGEEIDANSDLNGWCSVTYEGVALGGGKISGGRVKNHYPKGLRRPL